MNAFAHPARSCTRASTRQPARRSHSPYAGAVRAIGQDMPVAWCSRSARAKQSSNEASPASRPRAAPCNRCGDRELLVEAVRLHVACPPGRGGRPARRLPPDPARTGGPSAHRPARRPDWPPPGGLIASAGRPRPQLEHRRQPGLGPRTSSARCLSCSPERLGYGPAPTVPAPRPP